jgi:transitional endoplasmic reticulum ATPase
MRNPYDKKDGYPLKVKESLPKDFGKGRVRVNRYVLDKLGLREGDVILIEKKRAAVAVVWALTEDRGEEVILMDREIRSNTGANIDDIVWIKKVSVRDANKVLLAPIDTRIDVDQSLEGVIHSRLINRPVLKGNSLILNLFGSYLSFKVRKTVPLGPVVVREYTRVMVSREPVSEKLEEIDIRYDDIGGLDREIEKIREMVELPLRYPELFRRLGIEPPKGVLLHGPPGCGKTLLARAVANESEANFFAINGPEITSKYYGESEAKLREIFKKAEENAPSIIFIDELDAIAPKREEVTGEAEKRVVAQLLTLMDGLKGRGQVIVIGATNRVDAVDPALRRPGRFDREIEIRIPDEKGRLEILHIHTRGMPLAEEVDLKKLASITHGYTGADIEALCKEAAMKALKRYLPLINLDEAEIPREILDEMKVNMEDFMNAYREIVPTAMREVEISIPNVKWDDIGGLNEVKRQLREVVEWPLKYPDKFKKMGITPPKGILLFGPPGTGKTLLAQAIASETNMNFIAVKGPELLSKWVGESEKGVRRVFKRARLAAPAIIFFDEIEALIPQRGLDVSGVMDRVISQFLTELDGISRLEDIIVIGATNRPDMVDRALLRPGRMDLLIYVPSPDKEARLHILKIHTRGMNLYEDVDLNKLAEMTEYYSGADLAAIVREAAMNALRRDIDAEYVTMNDFIDALNKIGPSLNEKLISWYSEYTKKIIAKKMNLPMAIT